MSSVHGPPGLKLRGRRQVEQQDPVFIQVGALADGFATEANILASVDALAGHTLTLGDASGAWRVYTFEPGALQWRDAATDTGGFPLGPLPVTLMWIAVLLAVVIVGLARRQNVL